MVDKTFLDFDSQCPCVPPFNSTSSEIEAVLNCESTKVIYQWLMVFK